MPVAGNGWVGALGLLLGCLVSRSSQLRSAFSTSTASWRRGIRCGAAMLNVPATSTTRSANLQNSRQYCQHMAVPQCSTCLFPFLWSCPVEDSARKGPKTPVSCATKENFAQHGDGGLGRVGALAGKAAASAQHFKACGSSYVQEKDDL